MDDIRPPHKRPPFINDFGPRPQQPPHRPTDLHRMMHRPSAPHTPPHPAASVATPFTPPQRPVPADQPAPRIGLTALGQQPRRRAQPAKKPRLFSWARLRSVPRKKIIIRSILVIAVIILACGGWLGWKLYRNVAKVTHNNNPFSLLSAFKPVPLKNHNGRVNILVAGDSVDRSDKMGGGNLTDSIMILSLDTTNKTAFMISVPRDLWVDIPGLGHQKINAANTLTSFAEDGYPKGGMGSLEKVVSDNLGIPIDYYALVNYTAFRDAVNAVGGITVNIESPDKRGLYDPQPYGGAKSFKLANGVQTLNGDMALNLARARGEAYGSYGFPHSDFDRTAHQRQMVLALKDKASSASVIANPLKIGELADAMGNNIATDMKLDEMETLYFISKNVNNASIQSFSINDLVSGKSLLKDYNTSAGQEALIPAAGIDDFSDIQVAIKKLLSTNPIEKEGANVVVLNGGNINGLAAQESMILKNKGFNVVATSSPAKNYPATFIVDKSKGQKPATLKALQSMFPGNVVTSDPAATNYNADFVVILGENQAAPASSSGSTSN